MTDELKQENFLWKQKRNTGLSRKSYGSKLRNKRANVEKIELKPVSPYQAKASESKKCGNMTASDSPAAKRRSLSSHVSSTADRLSKQRFLDVLNSTTLFCVIRRLHMQHRKPAIPTQRGRFSSLHQGSMFCKPYSVRFPPGALPENLVVWIRCVKDMPVQPKSVSECSPWHLGRISYCKPAPGFLLGYLHQSGVAEDLKSYLMEWTSTGHSSDSTTPVSTKISDFKEIIPSCAKSPSSVASQCNGSSNLRVNSTRKETSDEDTPFYDRDDPGQETCYFPLSHKRSCQASFAFSGSRLTLDPSLRLDLVTGSQMPHSSPSFSAAACAPWQFSYYVHYQGYNRRYDRWVDLDELRPVIIDPLTNRVSSDALARHYVSALHSLGHPKWKSYVTDMKNFNLSNGSLLDIKPVPKEAFVGDISFLQAALLALRLLCSLVYLWANGHEANRGRRDVIPLLEWCCWFWGSSNHEGPLVSSLENKASVWVSQLLFAYFQLDAMEFYISALRANKKKKRSSTGATSRLTPSTSLLESEAVWNPLCSIWTAAVESLEHGRGISSSLLNDRSRSLINTWDTMILPPRSRDNLKPSTVNLILTVIEAAVGRVVRHRHSTTASTDNFLVFLRNYSCVNAFDDINSDAGEHEGIDPSSIEAHEAMTKVRTIDTLQIDNHVVSTWYYSPFPLRFQPAERVYICGGCLNYFFCEVGLRRHEQLCTQFHPPGHEIYRDGRLSFFQVDGESQSQYCENLSLISKLFLDHKTLQYSVTPFLFYILIEWIESEHTGTSDLLQSVGMVPAKRGQFIGYFSKEKVSSMGYNLACILTLPQHQRKGYGKYFMHFSYSLSKIEGKTGTPERPLSDLGRLSYTQYWKQILITLFLTPIDEQPYCSCRFSNPLYYSADEDDQPKLSQRLPYCSVLSQLSGSSDEKLDLPENKPQYIGELPLSVDDISHFTALRQEDIVYVLHLMKLLQKSMSSNNYALYLDATQLYKELSSCGRPPPRIEANQFLMTPWSPTNSTPYTEASLCVDTTLFCP